jgi:cell cycle sensor histidine kinase DivJ
MSHELRTPLNAIMGFSDIMRQRLFGPISDRYAEYADLIHESGAHLLELINDVLDMSKIEADRFELAREAFDAREAVAAALRLMRGQADRAGVSLRGVLPPEPMWANADRRAVKQIAINLLSNALKFTPRGGSVTLTLQADGDTLELVVADTGVGIAPSDLERLGRPFEQAGDPNQKAAGSGLGLSLVHAFAQLHGGEMCIESTLGDGATVIVRMPVLSDSVAAHQAKTMAAQA